MPFGVRSGAHSTGVSGPRGLFGTDDDEEDEDEDDKDGSTTSPAPWRWSRSPLCCRLDQARARPFVEPLLPPPLPPAAAAISLSVDELLELSRLCEGRRPNDAGVDAEEEEEEEEEEDDDDDDDDDIENVGGPTLSADMASSTPVGAGAMA